MKHALCLLIAVFICLAPPARANVDDDIQYIVDSLFYSQGYAEETNHKSDQIISRLSAALAKLGAEIRDETAFRDAILGPYEVSYRAQIMAANAEAMRELLSEDEIAAIADFLPTPDGQAFLTLSPQKPPSSGFLAKLRESPLKPFFEHKSEFDARTMSVRLSAKTQMREVLSMKRIANLIEEYDIVTFEDETKRSEVVKALRNLE
ncbi:MAG: hypothetical protein AAGK71_01885 [Pseudomonadota bacterium]